MAIALLMRPTCKIAGSGQSISSTNLRKAIDASVSLHRELLRHVHSFLMQTQTALANGRSKVEERSARWLLMAHDRVDGDELPTSRTSFWLSCLACSAPASPSRFRHLSAQV
jgi:hypothetical protein